MMTSDDMINDKGKQQISFEEVDQDNIPCFIRLSLKKMLE